MSLESQGWCTGLVCSLCVPIQHDEPAASWFLPPSAQFAKMAEEAGRRRDPTPGSASDDPTREELRTSLLTDPWAAGKPILTLQHHPLSEIRKHVLRVECLRCSHHRNSKSRSDSALWGSAIWKDVGQCSLDQACTN